MKTLNLSKLFAVAALVLFSGAARANWTDAEFDTALTKPHWTYFEVVCKKHHITESCEFLRGAHDFKHQEDGAKRGMLAAGIIANFIGAGTQREVNLPATEVTATKAAYEHAKAAKNYPAGLFDDAVREIRRMVKFEMTNQPARTADFEGVRKTLH